MSGFDIRFSGRCQFGCLVAELASAIAIGRTIEAQAGVSGGINLSFSQHQYSPLFSITLGRNDAKEFHCGYFFVLLFDWGSRTRSGLAGGELKRWRLFKVLANKPYHYIIVSQNYI